jgi:hypothetical protein
MNREASTPAQAAVLAENTNDLELAACLTTLGFECLGMQRIKSADLSATSSHPEGVCYWKFATTSEDGRYTLQQVLMAWKNDAWLTDPATTDPLAHIIVAFRNRQRLLDWAKQARAMVAIKAGQRWAFVPEGAPASHLTRAKNFLRGQ